MQPTLHLANTSERDGDKLNRLSFAIRHGVMVNKKGGYYCRGKQYAMKKKLAVAETYLHYKQLGGGRPHLSTIALEHKVDWCTSLIVSEEQKSLRWWCLIFSTKPSTFEVGFSFTCLAPFRMMSSGLEMTRRQLNI